MWLFVDVEVGEDVFQQIVCIYLFGDFFQCFVGQVQFFGGQFQVFMYQFGFGVFGMVDGLDDGFYMLCVCGEFVVYVFVGIVVGQFVQLCVQVVQFYIGGC